MVSLGIYHRQFFFFLGLFGIVFAIGWTITNQTSVASIARPVSIVGTTDQPAIAIDLADRGIATIDGTQVGRLVQFGVDQDEIRYVLLDQPVVEFNDLLVTMTFPRVVDQKAIHATALVIHDPETTWRAVWQSDQTLAYQFKNVGPGATITLVVQLPKGVILPSFRQRLFGEINSLPQIIWLALGIFLPLTALVLLVFVFGVDLRRRWSEHVSQVRAHPPDNLPPAVVGALLEGRVSTRALAATLVDLARRNYLEIRSHDGTYTFTKRRRLLSEDRANLLEPFEAALLTKIFVPNEVQSTTQAVQIRIGNSLFSQKVAEVYLDIYDEVTRRGYFYKNPSAIHGTYRITGLVLFFFGILGFGFGAIYFSNPPTPLLFWVGMIVAALVVIALAPEMPNHTPFGLRQRQEWLAFRNYLTSQRSISYGAQMSQEFFLYLPYAIALGVEVEWAGRFIDAPLQLPDWYSSPASVARWEDFVNDLFPMVGFLAHELMTAREPTLS